MSLGKPQVIIRNISILKWVQTEILGSDKMPIVDLAVCSQSTSYHMAVNNNISNMVIVFLLTWYKQCSKYDESNLHVNKSSAHL